ncbi:MAG: hypothetical protein A2521_08230 [Deltaproteobacteria bacterium RIFOXYD12_FULL_57_12]|nr:MAG: hypothetical protein A2521_08230 [Deltaproteobacteria bacterium RIFOXYD12_FULL_57_12]
MPTPVFHRTQPLQTTNPDFRNQLNWLFSLRIVLLSLFLGLNFLLQSKGRAIIIPPFSYIAYFIAGVYLFTIGSALLLLKIKRYTRFAYAQLLVDTTLVTCLIYYSGGSQSIFLPLYFFPVIAGSIILLRRGGLATAAACTLGYGFVITLEFFGYHPSFFINFIYRPVDDLKVALNYFSIHGLSFFMAAFLSALLAERLRSTEKALTQTSRQFDRLSLLYKQIFDDINTGIITLDNQGCIRSFNRAAEYITGYQAKKVLTRPLNEIFPFLAVEQEKARPAVTLERQDGTNIPIAFSSTRLNMPDGSEDTFLITIQDLSDLKKMEEQVQQAEKMAAIGEMAAGIAHEFRNPLAAISGSAEVLAQGVGTNLANRRLMQIIIRECTRLDGKISEFLRFSRPLLPKKDWIPLENHIKEVVIFLQQAKTWREDIHIEINIPPSLDCWADDQQLNQVLINLLQNSCQILNGQGGTIRITAEDFTEAEGREMTRIVISDSGPGIAPAIRSRIFEPFFTTRENGTGLGLAIVQQIVESHGGSITVHSEAGQGTTFEVFLPLP